MRNKILMIDLFLLIMISLANLSCSELKVVEEKRVTEDKVALRGKILYQYNETQPYTGIVYSNYSHGQLKSELKYKNGYLLKVKTWWDNGQMKSQIEYKLGKMDGAYRTWHKNAQEEVRGTYRTGKKIGYWTSWYDNGQVKESSNKDQLDRAYAEYYNNGNLRVETNIVSGKMDGYYRSYYHNGHLKETGSMENGFKVDMWHEFDRYGGGYWFGFFNHGHKQGEWNHYNDRHEITSTSIYQVYRRK